MICAIDPGLEGAICVMDKDKSVIYHEVMPLIGDELDLKELSSILFKLKAEFKIDLVILEKASTRPGQSAQSGLKTGRNYGVLEGMLASFAIPYKEIRPEQWSKGLTPIKKGNKTLTSNQKYKLRKERNLREAQKLFPTLDLRANEKCRVPHSGKVDSLLIANFGLSFL